MTEEPLLPAPWEDSYWVLPGKLLAGAYPGEPAYRESQARLKIGSLLDAGITCFIDLTQLHELVPYDGLLQQEAEWRDLEVDYQRFSIKDFGVPTPDELRIILDALDSALAAGTGVYVHCWGGIGRTGTVVGCWLARHHGREKALALLEARWRACSKSAERESPETAQQRQYIQLWQEPLDVQASNQSSRIP